jgi:transcriptional regulator with GAF, ATPase, and Fis domain
VKELRNAIERACITAQGGALEFDLLVSSSPIEVNSFGAEPGHEAKLEFLTDAEFRRRERENLFIVLQKAGWKIKGAHGAAELLGIKPTTLISRIEKLRLMRPLETSQLSA